VTKSLGRPCSAEHLSKRELLELLAEGQARIGDMIHAQLRSIGPFSNDAEKKAAQDHWSQMTLRVLEWHTGPRGAPGPAALVYDFRRRCEAAARQPVIAVLRETLGKLEP
jgi:hypothetical protein